jgi:1-acyl-sn-glycerol-3-phosphate acyltransferase
VAGTEAAAALPADRPLLLVANHTSWYDGFLLREVHRRVRPESPLRTLMLRDELTRAPILRWIGGVGFDPSHPLSLRGALRTVQAGRGQGVVLSFFPQGRIYPATRRPPGFHPGVEFVMRTLAPLSVLPVALHLEMGNRVRPTAWILAGEPVEVEGADRGGAPGEGTLSAAGLEASVASLLDRIQGHLHTHGEDAGAHWPPCEIAPAGEL